MDTEKLQRATRKSTITVTLFCKQYQIFRSLLDFTTNGMTFPKWLRLPFLSSNIPSTPAYGIYVSQLLRSDWACSEYKDLIERGRLLTMELLTQGHQKIKLVSTLKKLYGRNHDLVNPYNVAVSRFISDVFVTTNPLTDLLKFPYFSKSLPAGAWRIYNVASTSMQRHDVASTSMQRHDVASTLRWRYIYIMCLLGCSGW